MSRVSYLFYRRLAISLGCLESNTGGKKGRKEKSESACSKQDYFFRDSVLRSFWKRGVEAQLQEVCFPCFPPSSLSGHLQLSLAGEGILGTQITLKISFSLHHHPHSFPVLTNTLLAWICVLWKTIWSHFLQIRQCARISKGMLSPPLNSFNFHPIFDTVNFRDWDY